MNPQNREQRHKMVLLGGLYISQFLGLGFIIAAVPAILRQAGTALDDIAWIYLLGLIWAIKFLWAPLVDRFGSDRHGHYRSWLIALQSLLIVTQVGAAFFDINDQLSILAVFFALIAIFSATQDIAADALAVTILHPEERGLGNSIQTAGGLIGNMFGGGVVLITYQWLGWSSSMLALAAATALPLINILRHKEQPAPADYRPKKVGFRDLWRFLRRPQMWRWVIILLVFNIGISIAYALINPLLVDLGWSLDHIGFVINIVGSLTGMVGAFIAGGLIQRLGRKAAMLLTGVLIAVSVLGLYAPAQETNNLWAIYGAIGVMMLAWGASATILATVMMDKCNPASAGTDYSLQYSLGSIFSFLTSGLALGLAGTWSYSTVLSLSLGASILSLALVWFYNDFEPVKVTATTFDLPLSDDAPVTVKG
ncbi:MAG: MFS transporter [Chloroflexales bacterium]|nr:MFS transporter [Chloroflexales bacterium]